MFASRVSSAPLFEFGERLGIPFRCLFPQPVEVSFPFRIALWCGCRLCEVPDSPTLAAQFESFSSFEGVKDARGLPVQVAHGQRFHVRQYKPDIRIRQRLFLAPGPN